MPFIEPPYNPPPDPPTDDLPQPKDDSDGDKRLK